ncbi:alpha/beta fold hydrolase [Streptomyces sp. NBC_00162]|uniref:alpha/beta fold hydrolase n=1 Tax=Streptomyces sp. NBC_00162 TaxID=2903629 RepID=UPI00214ABB74|nr:alpha/beta hydrolase [Streptomyces sp. NBC_00162]UUU42741.1 alpha/beta hydrolase [Streptomyces sp. NBC_00162]
MRVEVKAEDGRLIVAEVWGAPDGVPVLLHHGMPGCRLGSALRDITEIRPDVRFFAYDRPGYGDSERAPGRTVADAAHDSAAVADALGVDTFAVVGRSGGGPHALACAALLPKRVTGTAALASLAPSDGTGLDWFGGMTPHNVEHFRLAVADPAALERRLTPRAAAISRDPGRLLEELRKELADDDLRVVADGRVRQSILENYRESLRVSAYGWLDDSLAFCRPWGFDPASIPGRVLLWRGGQDAFSPLGHFRWLSRHVPNRTAVLKPGAGHFAAQCALPEALDWLL